MTALAIGALLAVAPPQARASVFTVDMTQQGNDVVANGSGSFDLTGLFLQSPNGSSAVEIIPNTATLGMGAGGFGSDSYANDGSFGPGLIGPSSFGSGGHVDPSSGSGPDFLFAGPQTNLVLPHNYISDTSFTDSSTYANSTFASLGITPGTYSWTWDAGQNSLVLNVNTPEPASLTLLSAGMAGLLAVRRRRAC